MKNTCLFRDACFNWKLHSSLKFFGNELLYYKTQYSLKCCRILFGSFKKYMPFSRCLLQLGNAWLFETKYNSFLGNVYNFVWKSFFITIQIVPWSVAAIVLKNVCLFSRGLIKLGDVISCKNILYTWFRAASFNTKVQHVFAFGFSLRCHAYKKKNTVSRS